MEMGDDDYDFTRNMVRRLLRRSACQPPRWENRYMQPRWRGWRAPPPPPCFAVYMYIGVHTALVCSAPARAPRRVRAEPSPTRIATAAVPGRNACRCKARKVGVRRFLNTIPTRAPALLP
jgi:hypothetical protein